MVCKCVKCGAEWKARSESPRQCPECDTRQWKRIDSVTAESSSIVGQGDDKELSSPAVVGLSSPAVVTRVPNQSPRLCLYCDWKAKRPASDKPEDSELAQFANHTAKHNPSPAAWSDAYKIMEGWRRKAA